MRFGLQREPREGGKAASTHLRIESYSPRAKTEKKKYFPRTNWVELRNPIWSFKFPSHTVHCQSAPQHKNISLASIDDPTAPFGDAVYAPDPCRLPAVALGRTWKE